jgi:hypothetical protein
MTFGERNEVKGSSGSSLYPTHALAIFRVVVKLDTGSRASCAAGLRAVEADDPSSACRCKSCPPDQFEAQRAIRDDSGASGARPATDRNPSSAMTCASYNFPVPVLADQRRDTLAPENTGIKPTANRGSEARKSIASSRFGESDFRGGQNSHSRLHERDSAEIAAVPPPQSFLEGIAASNFEASGGVEMTRTVAHEPWGRLVFERDCAMLVLERYCHCAQQTSPCNRSPIKSHKPVESGPLASSTHVKADNPVPLPKPVRDGQRDHFRTRRRVAFDQIKAQHDRPSWRGREGSMFQVQCPLSSPRDVPVCADMELHTPNRPSPAHFAREHIHGRDCAFSRCALSAPCSRAFEL